LVPICLTAQLFVFPNLLSMPTLSDFLFSSQLVSRTTLRTELEPIKLAQTNRAQSLLN
jgi:hypothetical protein